MNYLKPLAIPCVAMFLATALSGCSDSDDNTDADTEADAAADAVTDDEASDAEDTESDAEESDTEESDDEESDAEESDGEESDAEESDAESDVAGTDDGEETDIDDPDMEETNTETGYPQLPSTLSVVGCSDVGPLCSVVQTDDGELIANCNGLQYTGTITEDGVVTLEAEPELTNDGATVTRVCEGELSSRGQLSAECTVTTSAVEDEPEVSESCELESDPVVMASVECMELPSELSGVEICVEGADEGGETIAAGTCNVIQDGCNFQAECDDGTTLSGGVSMTGISFSQTLVAVADAETPSDGGDPSFLAGELVEHRCSAELDGSVLIGECAAGRAGRGGTNTSVCAVGGAADEVTECAPLSPLGNEQIFVLDSCDELKNGEGGTPGVGEPLCSFRQTNCIWEIQCGRSLVYGGRVDADADKFEWRLDTATACEGSFDSAGEFSGVCAVPDLFSCDLWSKEAAPGGDECPSAPIGETVTSRGCGNGSGEAMDCRHLEWHGCDFMAICSFSNLQSLVFAGNASEDDGAGRIDMTGIADWTCHVEAPTEDDLESDPYRATNEWIGQCETQEGGLCRDTFDPATGEGFRGLQLFWGEGEVPGQEPEPAEPDAGAVDAGAEDPSSAPDAAAADAG